MYPGAGSPARDQRRSVVVKRPEVDLPHQAAQKTGAIEPRARMGEVEGKARYRQSAAVRKRLADGGREIAVDYEPGTVRDVELDDGSHVLLRKLEVDYDPTDAMTALRTIHEASARGEFVTGLLYVDTRTQDLCGREHMPSRALAQLDEAALRINREDWQKLMTA